MAIHDLPGQERLFEVGPAGLPPSMTERRAFTSALDERHLGSVALESIVEEDLELVEPDQFSEILFTGTSRQNSRHINGVAVNAAEAQSVPGSVNALRRETARRTQTSRALRGDTNADRRSAKAAKSQLETLRGYVAKREDVMRGLEHDLDELQKVKEGLSHPGLSRGSDLTVRMHLTYVVDFVFANMLGVLADELEWDNATRKTATETMRYQIIKSPKRHAYTRALTDVAIRYTKAKQGVFKGQYARAEASVARQERTQQADLLDSN